MQLPSSSGGASGGAAPSSWPSPQREQAAAATAKRELQGLLLNALSTVFGAGMSLFAKISGEWRARRDQHAWWRVGSGRQVVTACLLSPGAHCLVPGHLPICRRRRRGRV